MASDFRQTAKDAVQLSKDAISFYAPNMSAALKEGSETASALIRRHPKSIGLTAAAVVGTLFAHHRKKANDNIGNYSRTIAAGDQSGPSGSAAGLNTAKAAYIQPTAAGYDNPANQGARYNFKNVAYGTPGFSPMSRPQSYSSNTRMMDYRNDMGDINQDQQFSRMI